MFSTVDQALEELTKMEADVEADMGEEAVEAGFYDLVVSVAQMCTTFSVANEFTRLKLGYLPHSVSSYFLKPA